MSAAQTFNSIDRCRAKELLEQLREEYHALSLEDA